jgi:hypothetical protein
MSKKRVEAVKACGEDVKRRLEVHYLKKDLELVMLINSLLSSKSPKPQELTYHEIRVLYEAKLANFMPEVARQLERDSRLHPVAK